MIETDRLSGHRVAEALPRVVFTASASVKKGSSVSTKSCKSKSATSKPSSLASSTSSIEDIFSSGLKRKRELKDAAEEKSKKDEEKLSKERRKRSDLGKK